MHFVDMTWTWPFGVDCGRPDHPLAISRALRGIMDEGKPQGSVRWLFFQPNLNRPEVLWFGALLLSAGGRVVYFPASEISGFRMSHLGRGQPGDGFAVDHISLENDWQSWHLTGTDRSHRGGPRTVPLKSGGVLWFGMNSAGPEVMPRVCRDNVLRFEVPKTDSHRRKQLLKDVREAAVDQILALNDDAFGMKPPWSVQFNFLVGLPGFAVRNAEMSRFHVTAKDLPPKGKVIRFQTFARQHRIRLSDDVEVLIVTFPLPGESHDRWALMGWA